jgi:hypothetical protein
LLSSLGSAHDPARWGPGHDGEAEGDHCGRGSVTVTLGAPLGDRPLIDGSTGDMPELIED